MVLGKYKSLLLSVCFLFVAFSGYTQQYTVRGGKGTPMEAENDSQNRIQVYLVYGMENVEISYTSALAKRHQWFRYKKIWSEHEPVTSEQNGNTSTIRNIEDGYGYYVDDVGAMSHFLWLIDYSKYELSLNSLTFSSTDPCTSVKLEGDATIPDIPYNLPNGTQTKLIRTFNVTYKTMERKDEEKFFSEKEETEEIEGNPFGKSLKGNPLIDTEFRLYGDFFARHFGVEKSVTSKTYQAEAIGFYADTMRTSSVPSMDTGGVGLSLPVTIRFTAYANEPVAAQFTWYIWDKSIEDGRENPMFQYNGKELEYTFVRDGDFAAQLVVTNYKSTCSQESEEIIIQLDESDIKIPNAFSPGTSPGVNDEFKVVYKSLNNFKGWIFNRWGQQLFHWKDPEQGWDGKYKGKYVAPGAYFYIIEYTDSKGKKRTKKGDINVVRPKTINDRIVE